MARTPRWTNKKVKNGIWTVEISSWKYFHEYVRQEMLSFSHYVWRGQRDAAWPLQTSLDRTLRFRPKATHAKLAKNHLENFKMSARGRRGHNPATIKSDKADRVGPS